MNDESNSLNTPNPNDMGDIGIPQNTTPKEIETPPEQNSQSTEKKESEYKIDAADVFKDGYTPDVPIPLVKLTPPTQSSTPIEPIVETKEESIELKDNIEPVVVQDVPESEPSQVEKSGPDTITTDTTNETNKGLKLDYGTTPDDNVEKVSKDVIEEPKDDAYVETGDDSPESYQDIVAGISNKEFNASYESEVSASDDVTGDVLSLNIDTNDIETVEERKERLDTSGIEFYGGEGHEDENAYTLMTNKITKRLKAEQSIDIKSDVETMKLESDYDFRSFKEQSDRISDKPVSKTALPASGMNVSIRCYNTIQLSSAMSAFNKWKFELQNTDNPSTQAEAYLSMKRHTIESIYRNMMEFSIRGTKYVANDKNYELFLKSTKYIDMDQLFYAAYTATYNHNVDSRGNRYDLTCGNIVTDSETGADTRCGHRTSYYVTNQSLVYNTIDMSKEQFMGIRNGFGDNPHQYDQIELIKKAKKSFEYETTTHTKFYFGLPSIKDYLDTLYNLTLILSSPEMEADFDGVDITDIDRIDGTHSALLKTLLHCSYATYVHTEPGENNKVNVTRKRIDNRFMLFTLLSELGIDESSNIIKNKDINSLFKIQGLKHYIKNVICKKCGQRMKPLSLDMEYLFFFQTSLRT